VIDGWACSPCLAWPRIQKSQRGQLTDRFLLPHPKGRGEKHPGMDQESTFPEFQWIFCSRPLLRRIQLAMGTTNPVLYRVVQQAITRSSLLNNTSTVLLLPSSTALRSCSVGSVPVFWVFTLLTPRTAAERSHDSAAIAAHADDNAVVQSRNGFCAVLLLLTDDANEE